MYLVNKKDQNADLNKLDDKIGRFINWIKNSNIYFIL
jgi:hypothetical protein